MNRFTSLFLLLALLFLQCSKLKLNPNPFYQSDFPIGLNNSWEYERKDSIGYEKRDTLIATIVTEGVDLDARNLWRLVWKRKRTGELVDSQFIQFRHNKLIFYRRPIPDNDFLRIESQYEFPFKPEDEWEVGKFEGKYTVQENVENPYFGDAFFLQREYHPDLGKKVQEDILIGKGIGIISRDITYFTFNHTSHHTTFTLLGYHIE